MRAYYKTITGVKIYKTYVTKGAPVYELVKFEGCCDLVNGLYQSLDSGMPSIGDLVWDSFNKGFSINCSYDEYGSNFDDIKFCPNCGAPVELVEVD